MSLSDLLELSLNLTDGLVLQLLDLFKGAADHAQSLWVYTSCGKDLVSLSILSLQALLDRLQLLLQKEIAEASFAVHIVYDVVEPLKQLLLLSLNVLVLL